MIRLLNRLHLPPYTKVEIYLFTIIIETDIINLQKHTLYLQIHTRLQVDHTFELEELRISKLKFDQRHFLN